MRTRSIIEAVRAAINRAGGVKSLAAACGCRSAAVFRNELNPNNEQHKLGIERFLAILSRLRADDQEGILNAVCNPFGLVAVRPPIDTATVWAGDEANILDAFASALSAVSRLQGGVNAGQIRLCP